MNWYLVKLIFSIEVENRISNNLAEFDEQLRLIEDHSQEAALLKARKLGKSICTTFHNTSNQKVSWRFIDVREIIGLEMCIRDSILVFKPERIELILIDYASNSFTFLVQKKMQGKLQKISKDHFE